MSLKKAVAIVAAAGALAAISVPAMAFENEFHGIYNLRYYLSNVDNATGGPIVPSTYRDENKSNNFFEQRARLVYIAKASDDLKLVTHFELDSKFGGQGGPTPTSYKGVSGNNDSGQLDADSLTLETKNVYLDFNLGKYVNVKTGIQPVSDKIKGIFLSAADLAGINATAKLPDLTLNVGYFRITEGIKVTGISNTGHDNYDIALLDAQFNITKDISVGAEYLLASNYSGILSNTATLTTPETVHTFALYGSGKVGPAALSGFVAAQTGFINGSTIAPVTTRVAKSGYAANVAAKVAVGPGTAKVAYLFTSGDDNRDSRDTGWFGVRNGAATVTSYNESGMMLLNRNTLNSIGTNDRELIYQTSAEKGTGFSIVAIGYDAAITPKMFANVNAGMAFATKNQSQNGKNGSNLFGTEVNVEAGYKVYDNLTAKVQAAYVILGGYYAGVAFNGTGAGTAGAKDPENPYTSRIVLQYAF